MWTGTSPRNVGHTISPEALKRQLADKDAIGLEAEIKVLEYERGRIGTDIEDSVEHVAARDAAAGYDVKSVTITKGQALPRYIEVKAVSSDTCRFYWSSNEIELARALRGLYFLYLLPVEGGVPQIERLQIIPDPAINVLRKTDQWIVETDCVKCEMRDQAKGQQG